MKSLGRIAYEAYCDERHWRSFDDRPLPFWPEVNQDIRDAWEVAANEAVKEHEDRKPENE